MTYENIIQIDEPKIKSYWIAVFSWFLIFFITIPLIWSLQNHEQNELDKKVANESRKLSSFIKKDIEHRITALNRLADRWIIKKGTPKKEFYFDAHNYISDMTGFRAIEWVDQNFVIRWIIPEKGNEKALNLDIGFEEERLITLEKAKFKKKPTVSGVIDLVQGGKGFLIYFPLYYDYEFHGFIIAVFKISEWLSHVFKNEGQDQIDNYNILISYDGKTVFDKTESETHKHDSVKYSESFKIQDHVWRLHLCPNSKFIESEKDYTTETAAVFGFIMASLISFTVFMFLKANNESWKTNIVKMSLEEEIKERKKVEESLKETSSRLSLATNAGKVGVWSWEFESQNLIWNDIMFNIYNIPANVNPTLERWQSMIHRDDLKRVTDSVNEAFEKCDALNTEFRIVLGDGSIKNIQFTAMVEKDIGSDKKRMIGVNWDISSIKKAEEELKKQTEMQKILMSISSKYINIPIEEVDLSIQQALPEIGHFVKADRICILEYNFSDNTTCDIYEWCDSNIKSFISESRKMPLTNIWSWVEAHQNKKIFYISDVSKLPDGELKEALIERSIRTLVTVPMLNGNELMGFVGYNWVKDLHEPSDIEIDLFELFSRLLVNIRIRQLTEKTLVENKNRLDLAIKGTKAGLWDWYIQTGEAVYNEQWAEIIGYKLKELEPLSIDTWFNFCHPEDIDKSKELLKKHFDGKTDIYELEARMKHKNGDWVWVADRGQVVQWDKDNKPVRVTGTHIDITKRKESEILIKHMANHDALTGLPTIRLGKDRASHAIENSIRKKKMAAFFFIDLDGFKEVNDNHGHEAGDELLKEVAKRFLACVRKSDTVARIGGDEFLAVINELSDKESASNIATKLIESVSKPFLYKGHKLYVGTSIGISVYPQDGENVNDLIKNADIAMYKVKNSGKNNYAFV